MLVSKMSVRQKLVFIVFLIMVAFGSVPAIAKQVNIDFESIPTNTLVRNQFASLGLLVSGTGANSGLVMREGDLGTANFGNSPTHIIHIGNRGEPTTLTFVDPADGKSVIGASSFSIRMGDGNPDSETFTVTYFNIDGKALGQPVQFTTLGNGIVVSATSAALGARIGSVVLTLLPASASGVTADDLQFDLSPLPGAFHVFPQIADGRFLDDSFFRSTLVVNERTGASTACTLNLVGLTAGFSQGIGSSFSISVPGFAIFPTNGTQQLQTGYATLNCDTPVDANLVYTLYSPQGLKVGEATVFSSDPSPTKHLVMDETKGARLAVAIANDTDQPHVYTLSLTTSTGTTQTTQIQIQAKTSTARFLYEMMLVPPDAQRLFQIKSDDASNFSAIGLRFTGGLFTTVPAN